MKVFLTGAAGFIGSHVARVLTEAECDVLGLVRAGSNLKRLEGIDSRLEIIEGDLSDPNSYRGPLADWDPDACTHLAWYAEPGEYLRSYKNFESLSASLDLMQMLVDIECGQVVMGGTCAEYEFGEGILDEESSTKPETIYAATKLSLKLIGEQMAKAAGINFAWARFFYLYGPYEDERRMVPAVIRSLIKREPFNATSGEQVRDFLHVEDAAQALWTLTNRKAQGIFNISSGTPITVAEVLKTIEEIHGSKNLVRLGRLPYRDWEPMYVCGSNQRLKKLGWKPRYTLRDGLAQTIEWWAGQP